MNNENPCTLCPFYNEDSDGCSHPKFRPCEHDIAGFEVRVSDNPKQSPYVDYGDNGCLYYVIECTKHQLNNAIKQYAKQHSRR